VENFCTLDAYSLDSVLSSASNAFFYIFLSNTVSCTR